MAEISISIAGSNFIIGCRNGDEAHIKNLSKGIEERYRYVVQNLAPSGMAHAYFLTSLLLADELHDLQKSQAGEEEKHILEKAEQIIEERNREEERMIQAADLAERLAQELNHEEGGTRREG